MLNITDIKDLIKEMNLNLSDLTDQYDLRDKLDFDGSLHGLIDSAIDIYYYDLRKWAVDNYDEIDDAMDQGLAEEVTDFHKLIQIGQYNYLIKEADFMIGCIWDEFQSSNYLSAIDRLNRCESLGDIDRALKGFERVHQVGHLTDSELQQLDAEAFDILLKLQIGTLKQ